MSDTSAAVNVIGTNNGARKFLHYIVGFVTRTTRGAGRLDGIRTVLLFDGAQALGNVSQCLIPGNRFEFAATLATDHGGFQARGQDLGIVNEIPARFEARACSRSGATTMAGGKCTQAALALAELCYNTLLEEGEKAMLAAEQHVVTPALERVIEANTYLSGVGFESGGLAAAHAVHNGLTAIPDAHHYYHGEKVAFGTLTQLVLENAPVEEIETVAALSHAVGLPITLAQLDIKEDVPAKMRIVAEAACAEGETIHNMPGGATPDQVYAALLVADQYGQRFLQEWE